MKVLNIESVFATDVGKGIFPSYPAVIQGCRKPTVVVTKELINVDNHEGI